MTYYEASLLGEGVTARCPRTRVQFSMEPNNLVRVPHSFFDRVHHESFPPGFCWYALRNLRWGVLLAIVLCCVTVVPARAQQQQPPEDPEDDKQIGLWLDQGISAAFSTNKSLEVEFHERFDEGASNLYEYFVQGGVEFRLRPWLLTSEACFSISILCLAQDNPRVTKSIIAHTASDENPETQDPQSTTPVAGSSQSQTAQQDAQSTPATKAEEQPKKKKKKLGPGALVVAPLPISSPAIGSGIVPIIGYIFPLSMKDKNSPPSVVGAAGLITNNGSSGFAVGGALYLKHATYRLKAETALR